MFVSDSWWNSECIHVLLSDSHSMRFLCFLWTLKHKRRKHKCGNNVRVKKELWIGLCIFVISSIPTFVCILFTYHPIHFVIVSDNGWNSESIHVQIVTLIDVIFYNLCFYRTLKTQQLSVKMTHSRPWNITGKEKILPQMQQDFVKQFWRKIGSLVRGYEKSEGIDSALYVHHN